MKMKWQLLNTTSLCRSPDDLALASTSSDDEGELVDVLFASDEAEAPDVSNDEPKADGDEDTPEGDPEGDPDAELSDEEKAAKDAEGENEDPDADPDAELVFTVKIDGVESEATESDLIASYQKEAVHTKKFQALADDRRAFEQEREAELGQLKNALSYYALPTAKEPRPEDFAGKPEEFMQAYGQWQEQSARQSEAAQLLEAINTQENQRVLEREAGLLREKIPEWSDETVRQAELAQMATVATDRYGFTPEEFSQLTDHRLLPLLRDAMRMAEIDAKPVVMKRKTEIKPKLNAGAKTKIDHKAEAHAKAVAKLNNGKEVSDDDLTNMLFQ